MRYYCMVLSTNAEKIKENSKINLREYDYSCPISAMNSYMYKEMKNDLVFFAYREEKNVILAAFSYDEKKSSFQDAFDYILGMLNEVFVVRKTAGEPYEVTMHEFLEVSLEAKRRGYISNYSNRIVDAAKLWIYYYYNESKSFHYDFKEKIISENKRQGNGIYDKSFQKEISNIESHENNTEYTENIVHYVISSRSVEAATDMAEKLMQSLAKAHRLKGRRMSIISEIEPDVYKNNNHLEEIIENNVGGVILFNLSEKFGYEPVDYSMASKFIEKLVARYKNDCLFVFTYNMERPGFSYYLLP